MILPLSFLAGAALGWYRAAKSGGNRLDCLQYAATHGIALSLLALIATLIVSGLGWV